MDFFVALWQRLLIADIVMAITAVIFLLDFSRRGLYGTIANIEGGIGLSLAIICSGSIVITVVLIAITLWLTIFH